MFLLLEVEVADTMLPLVISMLANKRLERTDGINFMIIVVCLRSEIELDVCFG